MLQLARKCRDASVHLSLIVVPSVASSLARAGSVSGDGHLRHRGPTSSSSDEGRQDQFSPRGAGRPKWREIAGPLSQVQ